MQKPRKRNLHRRSFHCRRGSVKRRRLQGSEPAKRKERHISNALLREIIDELVITPVCHIVEVLDADYFGDRLSLSQLLRSDIAEAEMTDQSFLLEFGKHRQRFFDRSFRRFRYSSHSKVNHIQYVEPEISQVVVDGINQFLSRKRMNPGLVLTTTSTHFGDDHKTVRIRMQCPLNDLIGNMWTIEVAGIDVVHPHRDCLSQTLDGSVDIARRSPNLWTGELHCTVAHPVHVHCRIRKCER